MNPLEAQIAELVRAHGPLTGAELHARLKGDSLGLWQTCRSSSILETRRLGRQYLRLDAHVEGYARLSPSILREFFTYSVVGLADDQASLERRGQDIAARVEAISQEKHDLARRFIEGIREQFPGAWPADQLCVILAGDVVYRMAHRVPRPERSTGKLVDGSDIDLVVIVADDVPGGFIKRLDEAIYQSKYMALVSPSVREEIDYVVKTVSRVEEQLRFDTFKRMVACKILHEGVLLHGSQAMYDTIKSRLREQGIAHRLEELEAQARASRAAGQDSLLSHFEGAMTSEIRKIFYSADESEEFE